MKSKGISLLSLALCLCITLSSAQDNRTIVSDYMNANLEKLGIAESDLQAWEISDAYKTKHNGATHIHIQQRLNDIDVFNGVCNFTLDKDNQVVYAANSLIGNLNGKINTSSFTIDESSAIRKGLSHLGHTEEDILQQTIKAVYFPQQDELVLSWHLGLATADRQHVWNLIIDGNNGTVLDQWDQVLHCSFGEVHTSGNGHQHAERQSEYQYRAEDGDNARGIDPVYNVFAIPVESPNHGTRSLIAGTENTTASPFGWHDNNGQEGANFTITRGNNVFAFEDADNNGQAGYSPEGGPNLNFDFSYQDDVAPIDNQDAALTNLFYMNNIMHDVLYSYGFDEPSGNFQANNYGNGGSGGDAVLAQGFDGGGLNNATFFTPLDGQNPSMQMFLWNSGGTQEFLTINSPSEIAGGYITTGATFGPGIPTSPVTADVVLYVDAVEPFNDACEPPVNGSELNGKIVLIDRIECTFVNKILAAQNAGAVGVIMANNVIGPPVTMGGTSGAVNIPSVMITLQDGILIKDQLDDGMTVNATLVDSTAGTNLLDGNFDNAIIAHEYGHGISNRLIGGRFNTNCMINTEQMGEGWSDFFGTVLTINMDVDNPVYRPMGTFVIREEPDGFGIRPTAYDTSMTVNPYTYGNIGDNNISVPHGVGFIWCTMLWDLTWALIDRHGYDPDIYNGTGGNNIALQLVTDGLKLTNCSPGFVNGRDAILQADQMNNNGDNVCLIWEAFARRGLGFSASQGSQFNVGDGTEAFDLPPSCMETTDELIADFLVDNTISCDGIVQFSDASTGAPNSWLWDFGDGNSSNEQNPEHIYAAAGTYTVTLNVTSNTDNDDLIQTDLITVVLTESPSTDAVVQGCMGEPVELTASADHVIQWYNSNEEPVGQGSSYTTVVLNGSTIFYVSQFESVQETTCESERVEIAVEILNADFTSTEDGLTVSFEDLSLNATSWSWDFGDGNTSTDQDPVHEYSGTGTYDVTLTIDGLCSAEVMVNAVSTSTAELFEAAGFALVPNPARNATIISSGIALPKGSTVELIAVDGRKIQVLQTKSPVNEMEIDLKNVADGIYEVVVSHNGKMLIQKKLVVSR